jgi:hypothetical protein
MKIEIPQSWHVNKLQEIMQELKNDESESAKFSKRFIGEVLHLMLFEEMTFEQAKKQVDDFLEKEKEKHENDL